MVERLYAGVTESLRLSRWAASVTPEDSASVGVRGFGLAGFQYLRMLFGAQTTKPDVHMRRFVSDVVGHPVNDMSALLLLEQAARLSGLPPRDVDSAIWQDAVHR